MIHTQKLSKSDSADEVDDHRESAAAILSPVTGAAAAARAASKSMSVSAAAMANLIAAQISSLETQEYYCTVWEVG